MVHILAVLARLSHGGIESSSNGDGIIDGMREFGGSYRLIGPRNPAKVENPPKFRFTDFEGRGIFQPVRSNPHDSCRRNSWLSFGGCWAWRPEMQVLSIDLGHSSPSSDRRRATSPKLARVSSGVVMLAPCDTSRPALPPKSVSSSVLVAGESDRKGRGKNATSMSSKIRLICEVAVAMRQSYRFQEEMMRKARGWTGLRAAAIAGLAFSWRI